MAGRPSQHQKLVVWMNAERVGEWEFSPRSGHAFRYGSQWLTNPLRRPLSLSLPLEQGTQPFTGTRVEYFFDNLLPDTVEIRKRLSHKFGSGDRTFELLQQIGRDCVGAVQLLPQDAELPNVRRIEAEPVTDAQIERILDQAVSEPVPGVAEEDDFRISIAGAQEKTALLWHRNRWCKPIGATPTTHILKLPLGEVGGMRADFTTSVENEWLCSEIAREFGLPVAECQMAVFGRYKVLIVKRFDRRLIEGKWWARLPQEDFCQVYGLPNEMKYQDQGGPGMRSILGTLRGSETAEMDRQQFLSTQLLFWLLAAPDGHAKNFSLFLEVGGRYRLTPLYDIMSAWPIIGDGPRQIQWKKLKLAMAVRSQKAHYKMSTIQRRHWSEVAKTNGVGESIEPTIQRFITQAPSAIEAVARRLPPGFPQLVSDRIFEGIRD